MANVSGQSFTYPPFFDFPAFFTLQSNEAIRAKQLGMWKQLVCDYCAHHRLFIVNVLETSQVDVFRNAKLQRQLSSEGLSALASHMVTSGVAAWTDSPDVGTENASAASKHSRLLVFWRTPSEWADLVLQWVEGTGRIGSVETVTSLIDGDATEGEEFHGVPRELIMLALQGLEQRGRVTIFRGTNTGGEGVKFHHA